jgi:catechol 2,3-dioxygenase-like lactoylglutathione lyase family enzyme
MIIGIHHAQITVPKGSEDDAREFYSGVLGMKEIAKPSELDGRGGFWLEVGDRQIHIGTEEGAGREITKAHIAYLVENIDRWRRILETNSIEIVDGIQIPNYRRFEFRDPFGNRIEFMEKSAV